MAIDMSRSRPRVARTRPVPVAPRAAPAAPSASNPVGSVLIITDYIIVALSKRQDIQKAFPFFNVVVPQVMRRGCGKCGKNSPMVMRQEPNALIREVNRIRAELLGMSEDNKARFRSLVKSDRIEIHIPHPKGGQRVVF